MSLLDFSLSCAEEPGILANFKISEWPVIVQGLKEKARARYTGTGRNVEKTIAAIDAMPSRANASVYTGDYGQTANNCRQLFEDVVEREFSEYIARFILVGWTM